MDVVSQGKHFVENVSTCADFIKRFMEDKKSGDVVPNRKRLPGDLVVELGMLNLRM